MKKITLLLATLLTTTTTTTTTVFAAPSKSVYLDNDIDTRYIELYKASDSMKVVRQDDLCWVEISKNGETFSSDKVLVSSNFKSQPVETCLKANEASKLLKV